MADVNAARSAPGPATMPDVDLVARIDALTAPTGRCRVCAAALDSDGASVDFCGELHQQLWSARRAARDGWALTEAEVTEVLRQRGEQLAAAAEASIRAAARALTEVMRAAVPTTTVDPKARALAQRQQRNTGPRVHADPRRNRR